MGRIITFALIASATLAASGCGIKESKYIDYTEDAAVTPAACPAADKAFAAQMAAVPTSCVVAGCHVTQPISGKALSKTDAAINRAQLKAYNSTADKLFNKISQTGVTHTGGDQSTALPKANIDAWLAEEAKCP